MVAPTSLRSGFEELIDRETAHAEAGRSSGIAVKLNAISDAGIVQRLYRASRAGVPIDLIVRGMCVLRPGVPGVSETIRVRSIVGRFLEHSRMFVFTNGGDYEVYVGSADWMGRNLDRRVESVVPVLDPVLGEFIRTEILDVLVADNVKARVLRPDGGYERRRILPGEERVDAQQILTLPGGLKAKLPQFALGGEGEDQVPFLGRDGLHREPLPAPQQRHEGDAPGSRAVPRASPSAAAGARTSRRRTTTSGRRAWRYGRSTRCASRTAWSPGAPCRALRRSQRSPAAWCWSGRRSRDRRASSRIRLRAWKLRTPDHSSRPTRSRSSIEKLSGSVLKSQCRGTRAASPQTPRGPSPAVTDPSSRDRVEGYWPVWKLSVKRTVRGGSAATRSTHRSAAASSFRSADMRSARCCP